MSNIFRRRFSVPSTAQKWIPSVATALNNYTITADAGSYTVTGTNVTLNKGFTIAADGSGYSISGTVASLEKSSLVSAVAGSYSVTGTAATLILQEVISGDEGAYTISGTAASLLFSKLVSAASGSYSISGTDATLTFSGTDAVITAEGGSYSISGTDVSLLFNKLISAAGSSYSITGSSATLNKGFTLVLDPGSYSITGTAASFLKTYLISSGTGSYSITGNSATLTKQSVGSGKGRAHKKQIQERSINWNVDFVSLHKKIETKIETLEKAKEQVLEKKVKVPKVDVNVIAELEEEIENLVKLLDYLDTKVDYPKYQYKKKDTGPLFTFSKDELYKNKNLLDSLESTVKKKAKDEKIKKILDMLYKTGIL